MHEKHEQRAPIAVADRNIMARFLSLDVGVHRTQLSPWTSDVNPIFISYLTALSSPRAVFFKQVWADIDHVPPARHAVSGIRPDLALIAMERILKRTAEEEQAKIETAERRQQARLAEIAAMRRRHIKVLESERALGLRHSASYVERLGGRHTSAAHRATTDMLAGCGSSSAVDEDTASSTMTSASSSSLLPVATGLNTSHSLAPLVKGRGGRLKGIAAAKHQGLEGLVIPRFALVLPTTSEVTAEAGSRCLEGGGKLGTKHRQPPKLSGQRTLRSAKSMPAFSQLQPHMTATAPVRVPTPPSVPALAPPSSPSPQRRTPAFKLSAERGLDLNLLEADADFASVKERGLPLHGSLPVHQVERVLAATGTASNAMVAMFASSASPYGSPTGARPPSIFTSAKEWQRQKQLAKASARGITEGDHESQGLSSAEHCAMQDTRTGSRVGAFSSRCLELSNDGLNSSTAASPFHSTARSAWSARSAASTRSGFSVDLLMEGLSPSLSKNGVARWMPRPLLMDTPESERVVD